MTLKSIYDIDLNSAEGNSGFLNQYKGKVTLIANTTVGCGNANQMEILQRLQDKYGGDDFQIIAIPTQDYCGPGVTKGKWAQGITCGTDSSNYAQDTYNTTFNFSEMVASIPHPETSVDFGGKPGHNGLGEPYGEPHELYAEIRNHQWAAREMLMAQNIDPSKMNRDLYYSYWLNIGFYEGHAMGGNFEKYLVDKDGYVDRHFQCTTLNYDVEKTLKDKLQEEGIDPQPGFGRSKKIFEEEWDVICGFIEKLIAGEKAMINPNK